MSENGSTQLCRPTAIRRYGVFSGETYYPIGGWKDFDESFDDLGVAIKRAKLLTPLRQRSKWQMNGPPEMEYYSDEWATYIPLEHVT